MNLDVFNKRYGIRMNAGTLFSIKGVGKVELWSGGSSEFGLRLDDNGRVMHVIA